MQFLPPYSPDLNPIELVFSKVKSVMKANETVWGDYDAETTLTAALGTVIKSDCEGWIAHCGYM